jgi:hypothetical protein
LAGFLIPFPQTVAPAWTATIVDESGAPQAGVTVREVWQQYSLEAQSHKQESITDLNGTVSFPRRVLWRPYAANVFGAIRKERKDRKDSTFGPMAYLLATKPGAQGFADSCLNCSHPTPARIVMHKTRDTIPTEPGSK